MTVFFASKRCNEVCFSTTDTFQHEAQHTLRVASRCGIPTYALVEFQDQGTLISAEGVDSPKAEDGGKIPTKEFQQKIPTKILVEKFHRKIPPKNSTEKFQ